MYSDMRRERLEEVFSVLFDLSVFCLCALFYQSFSCIVKRLYPCAQQGHSLCVAGQRRNSRCILSYKLRRHKRVRRNDDVLLRSHIRYLLYSGIFGDTVFVPVFVHFLCGCSGGASADIQNA